MASVLTTGNVDTDIHSDMCEYTGKTRGEGEESTAAQDKERGLNGSLPPCPEEEPTLPTAP